MYGFTLVFCLNVCYFIYINRSLIYGKWCSGIRSTPSHRTILVFLLLLLCSFANGSINSLCAIVAATNIHSLSGYSQWSCSVTGVPATTPCTAPIWGGLKCSGSNVVSIVVNTYVNLAGTLIINKY